MKEKFLIGCLVLFNLFSLVSCSTNSDEIEYFPFRTTSEGKWGMISTDGTVLFESEFKNEPTVAINGCFAVKNSKDLYEIYTAEKTPKQIGKTYKMVTNFSEGLAAVVEPNKWICYINTKGEVEFELKTIKNKPVEEARRFQQGLAVVYYDGVYGVINKQGKLAFDKEFSFITNFADNGKAVAELKDQSDKWCVINTSGEVLFTCDSKNNWPLALVGENVLVRDEESCWFVNDKGEKIGNSFDEVNFIGKEKIAFKNENGYGVRNAKEVLIRAKYDNISYNEHIIGVENDGEWFFIDEEGDKVNDKTFAKIYTFPKGSKNEESNCIVDVEGGFFIADSKGNIPSDAIKMRNICFIINEKVESDYFEVDNFVTEIDFFDGGVKGMKIGGNFKDEIVKINPSISLDDFSEHFDFEYSTEFSVKDIEIYCKVKTNYLPTTPDFGWNPESTIEEFTIYITASGKLENKEEQIMKAIESQLSKFARKINSEEFEGVFEGKKTRFYISKIYDVDDSKLICIYIESANK